MHRAPIPFLTLPNWVKAASLCGFNIEPVFRKQGIATDLIHLESHTVSPEQLVNTMTACVKLARKHHFPFVLGETFAFDYMPDVGTFLDTSPSLREAMRVFDWVRELINPTMNVRLEERGDKAWLLLEFEGITEPLPYFTESTFAAIVKFGRALLGTDGVFDRVSLRYPAPPYASAYREYFSAEIAFGQSEHALIFDRSLLDQPLGGAFLTLHKQAEYRVERQLTRLPRQPGIVAAIEQAFAAHPELLGSGIDHSASTLNLHPRTLQRRLQDAGQSFGELQDRARFRLAATLLQDSATGIEAISERLGFSDRRSFTRAFTRWAGMSPSAFRKKPPNALK
jgi:AraC-like DNA-binding protein